MKVHYLAATAFFFLSVDFAKSQVIQENTWATNGTVFAVAKEGNTVYIGGAFSAVGPATGGGTGLDIATGTTDGTFPRVEGVVFTTASDGVGGWFIGGEFTAVGNVPRNNIAHIKPDKSVNLSWDPNAIGGRVFAIAINGSTVFVGGEFSGIGGQTRNRIAALDATTGLANAWNPNSSNVVRGLATSGSTVYAFGDFNNIGGQPRVFLAALDAVTGLATAWNPAPVPNVTSFAISGSTLYVGGNFTSIGGQGRNRIAALDLATGLATSWNPNSNATVNSIAVSGTTVYVGGGFTTIGGQSRSRIAAIDATTGLATTWNPNATYSSIPIIETLAVEGSTVYVGGTFSGIGGQARNHIAAVDALTGLTTPWNPDPGIETGGYGPFPRVITIVASGSTVYAGGTFRTIGGLPRNRIAAIDAVTGMATSWNPSITGNYVRTIVSNGPTVYVGGQFTAIGAQSRNNIGAIDAITGIVTAWNPDANVQIYALQLSGSSVLAGGAFTTIGGQARNRIAALDLVTGAATSWDPNANNLVKSIAIDGGIIYAGGFFSTIGGQPRNGLAAMDAVTGLATPWNPSPNNVPTNDIKVSGPSVYVGGSFNSIGGQTRLQIAEIDVTSGLATAWNPNHNPSNVEKLALEGGLIYAAGSGIEAFDVGSGLMAAWQAPFGSVYDVAAIGSRVFLGGFLSRIGGKHIEGFMEVSGASGGFIPTITSFTPTSGANGMTVTISGTNFHPTLSQNVVRFNGRSATLLSSSNTSITAIVPAGASSGLISVTVNGITGTSLTPFTVVNTVGSYPPCLFGSKVDFPTGNRPRALAFGDFNGDAKPDLAVANNFGNSVWIYQNTSTTGSISAASFASPLNLGIIGGLNPIAVRTGDLDGDGKPDLVVAGNGTNSICIYRSTGVIGAITAGSFEPVVCLNVGQTPMDVAIGDLDGDGKPELVTTHANSTFISVFRNQSTAGTINLGSFAPRFDFSMGAVQGASLFIADMDVDGKPDLVFRIGSSVSVLRNTSTVGVINAGSFAPRIDVSTGPATLVDFVVGDLDGDSKLDLVNTHSNTNTVSIRRNISSPGTITAASFEPSVYFPARPTNQSPRLTDLDGDGKPELLVADGNGNIFSVYRNLSTSGVINASSLELRADFSVGNNPIQILTGDIDGDGAPETIVSNLNENTLSIFRNVASNSSALTISSFFPTSGTTGAIVVISGTNFDPIPSNNLVNFNGVYATVTASTTTSITTSVPTLATDGSIEVIANCHAASLGTFTVGSGPTIIISPHPASAAVCEGTTTMLAVSASGTTNLVYQWQKFDGSAYTNINDGGGYSGTGTTTLSINTTGSFGTGDYRCKVSGDAASDVFSTSATLTVNPIPGAPTLPIGGSSCGPGSVTLSIAGAINGQYRWYAASTGGSAIAAEVNSSYTTSVASTTTYFAAININTCESMTRTPVTATINTIPAAPGAVPNFHCGPGSVSLGASGATNGQYRWYTTIVGATLIPGEVNSVYPTPVIASTTSYFVSINDGNCESASRTEVIATINSIPSDPAAPTVNGPFCSGSTFTFSTSGASPGEYRWYTVPTGGTPIAGATSDMFTTSLTTALNPTHYVSILVGGCESGRQSKTAVVTPLPAEPSATNPAPVCPGTATFLQASGTTDGNYRWYNGPTLMTGEVNGTLNVLSLSATTTFNVSIFDGTCESTKRTVVASTQPCSPPVIASNVSAPFVPGIVRIDLTPLLSDPESNLDLTTLLIVGTLPSGATATIEGTELVINYGGVPFPGIETIVLRVCDLTGLCSEPTMLTINLSSEIGIFNAMSPNGDDKNEIFYIENIDKLPDTQNNKVTIFNRWGSVVFETNNYNNTDKVFRGQNNSGGDLPAGTYYYSIEFSSGAPKRTGFLSLRK